MRRGVGKDSAPLMNESRKQEAVKLNGSSPEMMKFWGKQTATGAERMIMCVLGAGGSRNQLDISG